MKRLFSLILGISLVLGITFVLISGNRVQAYDPSDLVVGWWKLDGNAEDSANGYNGTEEGIPAYEEGMIGEAAYFGYGFKYVKVEGLPELEELTIEAWVKTDDPTRNQQIVDKGEHQYSSEFEMMIYQGNLHARVNKNAATQCTYPYPTDGEWHHVAYTFKNGEQILYLDGIAECTKNATVEIIPNVYPLYIGSGVLRLQYQWYNLIDNVKIYNRALTETEIGEIYKDEDLDGVENSEDICPYTVPDTWGEDGLLGTNRWEVRMKEDGSYWWYQNQPIRGGRGFEPVPVYPISHTFGCSGEQILELLAPLGESMKGHWKFGLSSSVLNEFHLDMNDGELDGMYLVDEVKVPGDDESGILSNYIAEDGVSYLLKASGTYRFAEWGEAGIADAMYSLRPPFLSYSFHGENENTWVNGNDLGTPYTNYLQLRVNGNPVDWIGSYHDHLYTLDYLGDGHHILFNIYDGGATGDNSGSLMVKIFAHL